MCHQLAMANYFKVLPLKICTVEDVNGNEDVFMLGATRDHCPIQITIIHPKVTNYQHNILV